MHARTGLMGQGGMSAGEHLVDVTQGVLMGAKLMVGQMSTNAVEVANIVPSGSTLTRGGAGGGLASVGLTEMVHVM